MNYRHGITLSAIMALGVALSTGSAISQQKSLKDQLVGTWTITAQDQTLSNGTKIQAFGANPKGILVFDANGRFYQITARQDLPKLSSNSRLNPTPEEAKAIAIGTFALAGTYTTDEAKKTFTVRPEVSTFANLVGTDQNWTIVSIMPDELKYSLEALGNGGQVLTTLRRAK